MKDSIAVSGNTYFGDEVMAIYRKNNKWRIFYNEGYEIHSCEEADELITEVSGEMNVRRENVKLVRCKSMLMQEIGLKSLK
jgi:hypothetical protein